MALTETGFYRPTYEELLDAQVQRAKMLFGEDIDTSDVSVLGKYIRINVADLDTLYQTLEGVYFARFPNTASGVSLDRLCVFAGISRNPATYAKHRIVISGTPDAIVEAGFLVSTQSQEFTFHTYQEYVIGEDGTVEAEVTAEQEGSASNVSVGSINYIVNPVADITDVSHVEIIEYGEDWESDYDLRQRFKESIAGSGSTTLEAIKAAIMRVPNVQGVHVIENSTNEEVDGVAPHSFKCFVFAPPSQDMLIAKAIFEKKPIGISTSGEESVMVTDNSGGQHEIRFSRTVQKDVYIKVSILTNSLFPSDGVDRIKASLVELLSKLENGDELYLSSLYGKIHIEGVDSVSSLSVSTDGEHYSAENIVCSSYEVARTSADLIEVTVA